LRALGPHARPRELRYRGRVIAPLTAADLDEARGLLADACAFDTAARVADEKLFGAAPAPHATLALGARANGRLVGVAVVSGRWLRLLAVAPDARRRGVGSALLDAAVATARGWGATRLRAGGQPGNYLAPGVDTRAVETLAFLARHGFAEVARYENLDVPLVDNPLVSSARAAELAAAAAARGYTVRRAAAADHAPLLAFAAEAFAPAWAFEVAASLAGDPPGVHLAIEDASGAVVAFACHDGNNRGLGWFGPAGTATGQRGQGLGQALLIPCLVDVAATGQQTGVIAWIGPRRFYEQAAGAVTGRSFALLEKPL
jgi:GNAT superfamily N-acetyltransferase